MKRLCCLFLLSLLLGSQAGTTHASTPVTIVEYQNMFHMVLDNLRTNYWSPDGNWEGDWMYDAMAAAPKTLYWYGMASGDSDLIQKANVTVDRNLDLVLELLSGGAVDPVEALMGSYCMLEGLQFYSGVKYADFPFQFVGGAILGLTKGLVQQVPNPVGDYLGYLFAQGGYTAAGIEYASVVRGLPGFIAAANALSVLETSNENYWVEESFEGVDYGYYWDDDPTHPRNEPMNSFVNAPMLMALAKAYGVTHKEDPLSRAEALLTGVDTRLWDETRGGYAAHLNCLWKKDLSDNIAYAIALMELYNGTGETAYLDRAREIMDFVEGDLFIEDWSHPGYFICSHDWTESYGTNPAFCTGCNFAMLYSIYRLNELVQNGPVYPDPIAICGQLPDDHGSIGDRLIYLGMLLLPFLVSGWGLKRFSKSAWTTRIKHDLQNR